MLSLRRTPFFSRNSFTFCFVKAAALLFFVGFLSFGLAGRAGAATNNVWSSAGNTDYNTAANWSLGHIPTTGEVAYFDATSVVNCTVSADITPDSINVTTGYTGTLNFNGKAVTGATAGDFTFNIGLGGTINMAASTVTVDGNFDWSGAAGTITRGTSTLIMTGTAKTLKIPDNTIRRINALTIQTNSSIEIPSTVAQHIILGLLTVNGALTINNTTNVWANAGFTQGPTGTVAGTSTLLLYGGAVTLPNPPAIAPAIIQIQRGITLPAGTYSPTSRFDILSNSAGDATFTWAAGTYTFTTDFQIVQYASAIGTLTVSGANNPSLVFQGGVTITQTTGTIAFSPNSTHPNQLTGTANQTLNLAAKNMGTWVSTKTAGTVTGTTGDTITLGGNSTFAGLTLPTGMTLFDANGYTTGISGDFTASCTTLDWGEGLWTFGGNVNYSGVTTNTPSTAAVTFSGTGNQTYTPKTGATVGGAFTVNKASGNFVQAGHISAASFNLTAGTLVPGLLVANDGSRVAVYIGDSIIFNYNPTVSYTYWNKGVGSQTTTQIAARFAADVVALTPKVVLMEGGVNDISGGAITKATFLANWTSMFDAAQAADIAMLVLKILPWTNGTNAKMQTRDDWNASLATLAAGYANTEVLDLSSTLGQFRAGGDAGNLWDLIPAYTDDGVHPNASGRSAMQTYIEAALFSSAIGTTRYNITTTGNMTIGTAGQVSPNYLAGVTWTVGGNFSATGEAGDLLTLNPVSAWTLNVTGTANASYVNVAYSNAGGGTSVTPTNSTDSGHNTNWSFITSTLGAGGGASYWCRLYENGLAPPDFVEWWEGGSQTSSPSSASSVPPSRSPSSSSPPDPYHTSQESSPASIATESAAFLSPAPAEVSPRTQRICARVNRWIPVHSPRRVSVLRRLQKWLGITCAG